jgi:His-Xaa-Ser system radical SAM maturase HxsC
MLGLYTRQISALGEKKGQQSVARLTEKSELPLVLRDKHILLLRGNTAEDLPIGFRGYFLLNLEHFHINDIIPNNTFLLPADLHFLREGDIVRFNPQKCTIATIYRKQAKHNTLLVTERCNNFCLMCSVPPKPMDDSYIVNELLEAIPLMDHTADEIIISGGEPTLLGENLILLLRTLKNYLPNTFVHVLSNGKRFSDAGFTKTIFSIEHPNLMIGIPIYSDVSNIHDYAVQAEGAFDETIRGIINLKRFGQRVEVRVVIHQQTYKRLPQLAEFLVRNLLFIDRITFMALELAGFARHNLNELWIDPAEYQPQLLQAVETLARYRLNISISNHQLCVLDKRLWPYHSTNVSDWKTIYLPTCDQCAVKDGCGGFFASNQIKHSEYIKPLAAADIDNTQKLSVFVR